MRTFSGTPAVASAVPGYEFISIDGIYAPAKTPVAIINRLNQEIVRAVHTPDVKDKFFKVGEEVVGSSPDQHAAYIRADIARLGRNVARPTIDWTGPYSLSPNAV